MADTPIKGSQSVEAMDGPAWRQTLKDFPAVVLASGVGYGIGAELARQVKNRIAQGGTAPAWVKFVPPAIAAVGTVSSLAGSRLRGKLKERREQASLAARKDR